MDVDVLCCGVYYGGREGLGGGKGGVWMAGLGKPGNKKRRRGGLVRYTAPVVIPPFSKGLQEME